MKRVYLAALLILIAFNLNGQKIYLTSDAPQEVKVGEHFTIKYNINTNVKNSNPSLNETKEFEILLGPTTSFSHNSSTVNGETTNSSTTTFTYIFIAPKAGMLTIPCLTIKTDQKEYSSNPLPIVVLPIEDSCTVTKPSSQTITTRLNDKY